MAANKPGKGWRRALRVLLVGGAFGTVSGFMPIAAQAKIYHHGVHGSRHVSHAREHVSGASHVIHADYRPENRRDDYSHSHSHDARLSHVDYRSDHRRDEHGHSRDLQLVHADYRSDHRRDEYGHSRDLRLVHADYRPDHRHTLYRHDRDAPLINVDDRSDYDDSYGTGGRVLARFSCSHLQCVPYAREVSHIELSGDAFLWWAQAAGRYERGQVPNVGSVLNFRATGRMPLGHVAVVTAVLNSRTILVTQANWVPGTITNDVTVDDVSPDNNWSEVRVEYGDGRAMGSVYPTYGFIYDKPAYNQTIYASNAGGRNEVAEAPVVKTISGDAPNRSLR